MKSSLTVILVLTTLIVGATNIYAKTVATKSQTQHKNLTSTPPEPIYVQIATTSQTNSNTQTDQIPTETLNPLTIKSEENETKSTSAQIPTPTTNDDLKVEKDEKIIVPFYSQFTDISDPSWKKVGCGIASLAMLIEFYNPNQITVDGLLKRGISSGAYLSDAGWIHNGLIGLANKYGLDGNTHDVSAMSQNNALMHLEKVLKKGPVMASVHYTFDPQNPIPHLVVINNIIGNTVYYNDPSEKSGNGAISSSQFLKAWKKRYIEIRPIS